VSVDPIYTATAASDTSSSASSSSTSAYGDAFGMDAFLTMFMAQVTNQNPLDPMDNTEFTAQLATFSQLEQLTKINESMEELAGLKEVMEQGNIVDYIGKGVTLAGDVLPVAYGYVGKVGYYLEQDAYVAATITDESGSVVATIDLGRQGAGTQGFQWDGKDLNGNYVADGAYQVSLNAYDDDGNAVAISDQTANGLVTGYQKGDDGTSYLVLGEAALPLSEVLAVYFIPSSSGTGDPTDDSESEETEEASYASSSANEYKAVSSTSSSATGQEEPSFGEKILKSIISLGGLAAALL
jgi:flagellar basal-body rod modification protein FlgD